MQPVERIVLAVALPPMSRRKRANCGDATARFAYWCATNEADALERPMRRASSRGPEVSHAVSSESRERVGES